MIWNVKTRNQKIPNGYSRASHNGITGHDISLERKQSRATMNAIEKNKSDKYLQEQDKRSLESACSTILLPVFTSIVHCNPDDASYAEDSSLIF